MCWNKLLELRWIERADHMRQLRHEVTLVARVLGRNAPERSPRPAEPGLQQTKWNNSFTFHLQHLPWQRASAQTKALGPPGTRVHAADGRPGTLLDRADAISVTCATCVACWASAAGQAPLLCRSRRRERLWAGPSQPPTKCSLTDVTQGG